MLNTAFEDFEAAVMKAHQAAVTYYHTGAEPAMTDAEYDALVEYLETVVAEQPTWGASSPTYQSLILEVAGGTNDDGDVPHDVPMLSLKKAKDVESVLSFVNSFDDGVVVEPKLDGSAISVKYRNGALLQAVTRGDGHVGTDVTARLKDVHGLPEKLATSFTGEVRGEVYMTTSQFESATAARLAAARTDWELASARAQKTGRKPKEWKPEDFTFSNSRNAVSGLINREGVADFDYSLSFAAYDVLNEDNVDSHFANMARLETIGITSAVSLLDDSFQSITDDASTVESRLVLIGENRDSFDYPTDGAVIKADSAVVRSRMGVGSRHPRWALAYKYEPETGISQIQEIIPSIGRTGRLALRARITPVQVGTLITYVSLHNVDWLQTKDFRVGDTVVVSRRNDVIPQIEHVVSRPEDSVPWVAPEFCLRCGEAWNKETLLWRCDTPACGAINGVIHAAGREFFDWDGMSKAVITQMFESDLIDNVADVFTITEYELANLVMRYTKTGNPVLLGEKNAAKIYQRIQKSKSVPLAKVIAALGIRTLGRTFGRRLAAHFGSMDALRAASVEELQQVEGIQEKAFVIHTGLQKMGDTIDALAKHGVNMVAETPSKDSTPGILTGKNVCVTGSMSGSALDGLTRPQVQELIEKHGGRASSSVSSSTHILVAAGTSSSKYKKAVSMGDTIQILEPTQFAELLGL